MRVTIDISDELHRRVKAQCAMRGETLGQFVTRALEIEIAEAVEALRKARLEKKTVKGRKTLGMTDRELEEFLSS